MWEKIQAASYPLIASSTIGYTSACLILLVRFTNIPLDYLKPTNGKVLRALLALVSLLAGIAALLATQPNVGTLAHPLGILPYAGVITVIAAPVAIIDGSHRIGKLLATLLLLIQATISLISLAWVIFAWLSVLLSYYSPYSFASVAIVILVTLALGLRAKPLSGPNTPSSLVRTVFFLLISIEATIIFVLANLLLLTFVGLVLNA